MKPTFTTNDIGCWIDCAYGMDHAREKLADMVEPWDKELATELRAEAPDDLSDMDDATDLLQDHTTKGLVWHWEAGDLVLTTEDNLG